MMYLFLIQLSGDIFWVGKMTLSVVLIAKAMMKKYILLEVFFGLMYLLVSIILLGKGYGIVSVPIAHLIYNLLYFMSMIFIFKNIITKKGFVNNLTK